MASSTSITGPSVAERVRNACAHAEQSMLAIPRIDPVPTELHLLRACGDVVAAVPIDSPVMDYVREVGAEPVPAVLELTDNAPIPMREPVRSLVWLRGALLAVPANAQRALASEVAAEYPHTALLDVGHTSALVRLVIESAVVADATGAEPVCVDALRAAAPDPFWEMESAWLQHLDADHQDVIESLARKLPPTLTYHRVRPLAVDRYGLTLRLEGHARDVDIRLPFAEPVADVEALGRAVRVLIGCPFMNGLRKQR